MSELLGKTHLLAGLPYNIVNIAQHTEKTQKFAVYSSAEPNHFWLRNLVLAGKDNLLPLPRAQSNDLGLTVWEHYKYFSGETAEPMTYVVHGIGVDVEYLDQFVLYSPTYKRGFQRMEMQGVTCLARPKEMFLGHVDKEKYKGPRFRRVE